ncbi:hypothetical protein L218DRAFT_985990 [Marasmius fiardii PR-910]|nr:hypothetical protein L218DRAFT_985990 [Marasmius fiardii PR-910]
MQSTSVNDPTGAYTRRRRSLKLDVIQEGFKRMSYLSGTPSCQVRLPIDLLQQIMDELDEESIRQCALAARCFLVLARRRLFTAISLCEEEYPKNFVTRRLHRVRVGLQRHLPFLVGPSRTRQLSELLTATPELGEYTEELIIEGLKLIQGLRSWYNEKDAPLPRILPRLQPNLTSISLVFHQHFPLQFHTMPLSSCEALIRAVESPTIRKVVLENVEFSDANDLIRFLKHASIGGGLVELAITLFYFSRRADEAAQVPDITSVPNSPNALSSLQLNGRSDDIEKVLQWMRSPESYILLDQLESLVVVTPLSPESLSHITEIIHSARDPSKLSHLGLTSAAETLRCLSISSCPLAQTFLPSQNNLRTIHFYPVSRNYDHLFSLPTDSVEWWCGFLKTFHLPNLTEFRVSRRGTHAHYMICSNGVSLFGDPVENTTQWQRLEAHLAEAAPKATLYIDIRSRGYFCPKKWKSLYFPDDTTKPGYTNFEVFFPLAHEGKVELVIDVKVNTKAICRRQRLREDSPLPKALVKHRGHFVYRPKTRWDVIEDTMCPVDWHESVSASRSEFEYVFLSAGF